MPAPSLQPQPASPPIQPLPPNQTPISPPKTNWWKVSTIVLSLILASGSSYLLLANKFVLPSTSTPPTTQPTTTPSSTPDPTAEWKMYTSPSGDFSFRYPINPVFVSDCCSIGLSGLTPLVVLAQQNTVIPETDAPFNGIAVAIDVNPTNLSFDAYMTKTKSALIQTMVDVNGEVTTTPKEETVIVAGQQGVLLTGYTSFPSVRFIYVPFPNNKQVLVIAKNEQQPGSFTLFNQILSTFQFTN